MLYTDTQMGERRAQRPEITLHRAVSEDASGVGRFGQPFRIRLSFRVGCTHCAKAHLHGSHVGASRGNLRPATQRIGRPACQSTGQSCFQSASKPAGHPVCQSRPVDVPAGPTAFFFVPASHIARRHKRAARTREPLEVIFGQPPSRASGQPASQLASHAFIRPARQLAISPTSHSQSPCQPARQPAEPTGSPSHNEFCVALDITPRAQVLHTELFVEAHSRGPQHEPSERDTCPSQ
jgi:hypothetical protein